MSIAFGYAKCINILSVPPHAVIRSVCITSLCRRTLWHATYDEHRTNNNAFHSARAQARQINNMYFETSSKSISRNKKKKNKNYDIPQQRTPSLLYSIKCKWCCCCCCCFCLFASAPEFQRRTWKQSLPFNICTLYECVLWTASKRTSVMRPPECLPKSHNCIARSSYHCIVCMSVVFSWSEHHRHQATLNSALWLAGFDCGQTQQEMNCYQIAHYHNFTSSAGDIRTMSARLTTSTVHYSTKEQN